MKFKLKSYVYLVFFLYQITFAYPASGIKDAEDFLKLSPTAVYNSESKSILLGLTVKKGELPVKIDIDAFHSDFCLRFKAILSDPKGKPKIWVSNVSPIDVASGNYKVIDDSTPFLIDSNEINNLVFNTLQNAFIQFKKLGISYDRIQKIELKLDINNLLNPEKGTSKSYTFPTIEIPSDLAERIWLESMKIYDRELSRDAVNNPIE